jgi:hypothetical protein
MIRADFPKIFALADDIANYIICEYAIKDIADYYENITRYISEQLESMLIYEHDVIKCAEDIYYYLKWNDDALDAVNEASTPADFFKTIQIALYYAVCEIFDELECVKSFKNQLINIA